MFCKVLFFLSMLALSSISASSNCEVLNEITANGNVCVERIEGGKIYLKPERIFSTNNGLYLDLNESDFILLTSINSDSRGCYLNRADEIKLGKPCPWCGLDYIISCRNPFCPGKPKK